MVRGRASGHVLPRRLRRPRHDARLLHRRLTLAIHSRPEA